MTPGTFAIERDNVKYIQYYGVWDTDELYDLNTDPDEMHNLVNDPAWAAKKQELRVALYQQLADRNGRHNIPYSARLSIGAVRRDIDGPRAADFPADWYVKPNPVDRLDPILPDVERVRQATDLLHGQFEVAGNDLEVDWDFPCRDRDD